MKLAQVLQRIEAWKVGAAVPLGETLPWPRAAVEDRLVLAFVRMAGESLPWGFAAGRPDGEPVIHTIPEPRDAGELARLAGELGKILLPHAPHPESLPAEQHAEMPAIARRRQLWLPGPTHVEMLHFLDYRYSRKRPREEGSAKELNALGRAAGWLFRESTRPGQTRVLDATERLREAFAFPTEDVRQAHLGFLLAWLPPPFGAGSREDHFAAAHAAEALSIGVTMAPELEAEELAPRLARWNEHRGDPAAGAPYAAAIHAILEAELRRRFQLTVAAMRAFDEGGRPANPELGAVLDLAAEEFTYQYWNHELRAAVPNADPDAQRFLGNHPETDFMPAQAAARYFAHSYAAELTAAQLVHGDPALVEAAIQAGSAIRGRLVRVVNEGTKRLVTPVWTVTSPADGVLRLREESTVCVAGLRGRIGRIRAIDTADGVRTITVVISDWKRARPDDGAPAADDAKALEGIELTLLAADMAGITKRKSTKVWDESGPGAWLTHAAPPPERAPPGVIAADLIRLVEELGGP